MNLTPLYLLTHHFETSIAFTFTQSLIVTIGLPCRAALNRVKIGIYEYCYIDFIYILQLTPFFLPLGLLWLAAFTLSTWKVSNSLHDPTYSTAVDSGNFLGVKVFFFIVGKTFFLFLEVMFVCAFDKELLA